MHSSPNWFLYITLLNFLLNWGTAAYVWWSKLREKTDERFVDQNLRIGKLEKKLDEKLALLEQRLTRIGAEIRNTPLCSNHQRMEQNDSKLFERLDVLHGDVREMVGGIKGLTNSLEIINQHLLISGKRPKL
jgi:predicted nuclease with TOPRIM domain